MIERLPVCSLAGLPGMPTTAAAARRLAAAEGWRVDGGAVCVADLPAETRAAIAAREVASIGAQGAVAAGLRPLSETAERRAAARLAIVQAWRAFAAAAFLAPSAAADPFSRAYNQGGIPVEDWVRAAVDHVCARSLLSWARASARDGFAALAGRHGEHRKGTGTLDADAEMRALAIGLLAASPHVDAAQVHRALEARFAGRELPSLRSVQRFVARYRAENPGVLLSLANPDAHRSRLRVAFGSASGDVLGINCLWELDSTPTDVVLADGRRYALIGVIDVWSRRLLIHVAPTSSGLAVTTAIRRAILAWGVPDRIKTDNGKDYVSLHVERGLADLRIEHVTCPPYTPEGKPHIERVLGTLSHQFLELLPGYVGHSVADQQAIRSRISFAQRREQEAPVEVQLTADALQAKLDGWCRDVYGRARHRSLGQSPFERAASWTGPVRRVADERALDVLLAPAPDNGGIRRVGKKGIALEGTHFIAAELGPLVGEDVMVRLDPADMGSIWVFATDGRFVAKACCPHRTGIDRAAVAAEAKHRQREAVAAARKELKAAARRIRVGEIADELLAAGRRRAGQVVALPRKGETHTTPALDAAAVAARADDAPVPAALSEADRRAAAKATGRIERRPAAMNDVERARANGVRVDALEEALGRGEAIEDADARWLALYRQSKEYRAHVRLRLLAATG